MLTVRRKRCKITTWNYRGRKSVLSTFEDHQIAYDTGFHLPIDPQEWDVKIVSRVQKQLRQYFYNWLCENNFSSNRYVLVVDGNTSPHGSTTYIGLRLVCTSVGDREANKAMCEQVTDKMYQLFNYNNKLA